MHSFRYDYSQNYSLIYRKVHTLSLIHIYARPKLSQIAKLLHRYPSSISREWKRYLREGNYSPCHEQKSYYIAKSHFGRKRILVIDRNLSNTVRQTSISRVSMVS